MYTLIIAFVIGFVLAISLWIVDIIKKESTVALICLICSICFIVLPGLVEKTVLTKDMQIYDRFIDAEVYYSPEEEKYYALLDKPNSFVFWDLYELKEVDEVTLKEKEKNRTMATRLLN